MERLRLCNKFIGSISKKFQTAKVLIMEGQVRVNYSFCGEEFAYHGATSTMNEYLRCKHPVETDLAPKPKQLKLDTYTACKTCTKERSIH